MQQQEMQVAKMTARKNTPKKDGSGGGTGNTGRGGCKKPKGTRQGSKRRKKR